MKNREQLFNKPIMDIIKSRHSVRTYNTEKLSGEIKQKLSEYADDIKGPFDARVRLESIDSFDILEKASGRIGTYGVIKGAQDYIAGIVESGDNDLEQLGYILEKFILYGTSLDLGTCWLGGTFKRSDFAKLVTLHENEKFLIVTPIGYARQKRSIVDSLMRFSAGSNNRKPWEELFFNENWSNYLDEKCEVNYANALEAVRLAPSASNKQPWRILKRGNKYHFYLKSNKGYSDRLGFNIQRIDMGIAMCHFELALKELGIYGNWVIEDQDVVVGSSIENLTYTATWIEFRE
ncbi:nitroreductase [Alkalibaculum sp. M08DMB]|uniref:Nitroreductase n=1 Tax=Alkalibaculum sporogenes TaxID=2655001 RepID=A0A6A7K8X4_9FIRM|nr:nitroreductase family protein [Alkalibaculum sporogenes]MPW25563.1 nitroreductase [Alkalibaculum sporogenes]